MSNLFGEAGDKTLSILRAEIPFFTRVMPGGNDFAAVALGILVRSVIVPTFVDLNSTSDSSHR